MVFCEGQSSADDVCSRLATVQLFQIRSHNPYQNVSLTLMHYAANITFLVTSDVYLPHIR